MAKINFPLFNVTSYNRNRLGLCGRLLVAFSVHYFLPTHRTYPFFISTRLTCKKIQFGPVIPSWPIILFSWHTYNNKSHFDELSVCIFCSLNHRKSNDRL